MGACFAKGSALMALAKACTAEWRVFSVVTTNSMLFMSKMGFWRTALMETWKW